MIVDNLILLFRKIGIYLFDKNVILVVCFIFVVVFNIEEYKIKIEEDKNYGEIKDGLLVYSQVKRLYKEKLVIVSLECFLI